MKVKFFPENVKRRIKQICVFQNRYYSEETDIEELFVWSNTGEGFEYWNNMSIRYNKRKNELKI